MASISADGGNANMQWEELGNDAFMARLPLAQTVVDYDAASRTDEGLIARLLSQDATRVVLVNRGLVAVPKESSAAAPAALDCDLDPAAPRPDAQAPTRQMGLALLPAPEVRDEALRAGYLAIYLGIDRTVEPQVPYIALDVTRAVREPEGIRAHVDADLGRTAVPLAVRALRDFDWVELRSFAPCADARDAGLATSAIAVTQWHANQRFCPSCGHPVEPAFSGWAQRCTNPADKGRMLFPRIEPAIITAIVDDRDRILLQHNTAWRPRFHSVSAGFVEAGETLEHAVRREAAEEVGIQVGEVHYLGSQSWPFPASIMLGFRAHALTDKVSVDGDEVSSARWYTREELSRAVDEGELELPGRASIARHMIEDWYGSELG